ncbi:MAG: glycosyltransferase family 1 protein [Cyanobacteria bacterium SW_4_48_29]|nr:MAG: glycosyltransferase family 1 protein [Cyanobacteria bacterium SW_8_48_13]PSP29161.1 MAG: glycosyltransferase family 1 protein [Cyanobacteria bacterium SW_4_48_29]
MKVAFVTQPFDEVLLPQKNSLGIWVSKIAQKLSQSCEVVVYTKSFQKNPFQKEIEYRQEVCYKQVPLILDRGLIKILKSFEHFPKRSNSKRPLFSSSFYYLGYILQIAIDLRKQQCDLVHVLNFSQFVPIIRAFNPNIKIVLNMRCEWLTQLDYAMTERRLCQVNLVLSCSDYITKEISGRFPQFASLCKTVHNGVDIHRFIGNNNHSAQENSAKKILFVGRVSPEKGVHVLLEAFQKVVEQYPETQLELVGSKAAVNYEFVVGLSNDPKVLDLASFYRDDWLNHLSHMQEHSSVANQVSFTGSVPHSQLVNYYQNTDIFVFPSVWNEPFGVPLIEAMATGVPVIATQSGAFPEIVEEGKTGLLVERGDASALADAILRLLQNEDLRKSMGEAGRQRSLENFSFDRVANDLYYQYERICDRSSVLAMPNAHVN